MPRTPEEERLRDKFGERLTKLDEEIESAREKYGLPLLKSKKEKEPLPGEKLKSSAEVFVQGKQSAWELYEALQKAGPFSGERTKQETATARKYALACYNYFGYLEQVTQWADLSEDNRSKVDKQWELVRDLRGRWQASKVWH